MGLDDNPPEDPKNEFDAAAHGPEHAIYVGGGDFNPDAIVDEPDFVEEMLAYEDERGAPSSPEGDDAPEHNTSGESARQQEAFAQDQQKIMGRKAKEKSLWGRQRDRMKWGINEHEKDGLGFLTVTGRGNKNPQMGGLRDMTDKQMMAAILKLHYAYGCETLYFYRGNNIDPSLTQRANDMIQKMQRPGGPLEGHHVQASSGSMPCAEPWGGFYHRNIRRPFTAYKAEKAQKKAMKDEEKLEKKVKPERFMDKRDGAQDAPPGQAGAKDGGFKTGL